MAVKHRSRAPFALGLDPAAYNYTGLKAYSPEVIKSEYSRLRREAEDRLRKLGRSEFRDSEAYRRNVGQFPTLKELGDDMRALRYKLIDAQRFIMAKASSASGQREIRRENISTLHAHFYTWVNTKNFKDFTDYMEELRAKGANEEFYKTSAGAEETEDGELRGRPSKAMREAQRRAFEKWRAENGRK